MQREPRVSETTDLDSPARGRVPYVKPRILFREPLEAVAAACTPRPPGKANLVQCQSPQS